MLDMIGHTRRSSSRWKCRSGGRRSGDQMGAANGPSAFSGDAGLTHGFATPAGVRLHFVESGPAAGPPVLLFHGFPEFWYGWRHQLPALAAAGFRAVAPDGRGYNLS